MVTQIKAMGSAATDVLLAPLAAAKLSTAQDRSRTGKTVDSQLTMTEGRPVGASDESIDSAVKEVSSHLAQSGSKLEIQYDKTSGRNVFKVVDSGTGGVVLQIPSEEVLSMARKLRKTGDAQDTSGVLMDKEG